MKGVVVDIDADFYIDYGFGTFLFTNQVVIDGKGGGNFKDIFATDGDSGSIVVDEKNRAVAMLFAEAGRFAVACKFSEVLKQIDLLLNPPQRNPIEPKPRAIRVFKIVNKLPKEIVARPRSTY